MPVDTSICCCAHRDYRIDHQKFSPVLSLFWGLTVSDEKAGPYHEVYGAENASELRPHKSENGEREDEAADELQVMFSVALG